jgi:hypothetical protein
MALRRRRARTGSMAVPFISACDGLLHAKERREVGTGCLEVCVAVSAGVPGREASGRPAGRRFSRPGDE